MTAPAKLPEIRGRAVKTYKVDTLDKVDQNLRHLCAWLDAQITKAPEFGGSYLNSYRHDLNALLDARLRLMRG